ncbi:hypothetical protein LCGC14_1485760 [marine sediment metagenome]|uniref:Macro domain-containing protein n=1 Tax=marine sediment metagenome TaxID=412755 RepID=A0A0F9J853_9ZZZZ
MITYKTGDLFESKMQTLVITVNCVGVMGKGIALECKKRWPHIYEEYRQLCKAGKIKPGECWSLGENNRILAFATKDNWRFSSELPWIEKGLKDFAMCYAYWGIHKIVFPALGCGNGGLDFVTQVKPLMEKYLRDLPIEIEIYEPR